MTASIWVGVIAVFVCASAIAWAVRARQRVTAVHGELLALRIASDRLVTDTVPEVVRRLRDGASVDTALAESPEPEDDAHRRLVRAVAVEIGKGERMRAAAMSACASAAGRVQALTTTMLADLREMEQRHSEETLGDLLKLDHTTAQAGRLADSIAVLTGARSGRRWTRPIVMESILRGAISRINAYQRVRVHSASQVAIAGYAAEGVMHALAELMDNATSFSPPSEQVHVYVEEVPAGVVITIEDGGLVMGEYALRRAEAAVSADELDLTTLSGTRLGLAVVGCLARKHGLTVSFRPSSRGGTGVVVMVPRTLVTEPRPEEVTLRLPTVDDAPPATTDPKPEPLADNDSGDAETGGLPRRRRGQTLAAVTAAAAVRQADKSRPSKDFGARFGAFRNATRGKSAPGVDEHSETAEDAG